MPQGFEAQVRSRSGLALDQGLVVAQGIGTIDSDYRGEVGVILHNISNITRTVWRGDRIAQLVFGSVFAAHFSLSTQLGTTERGEKGYGSTGF
jgi:dUTP pyrophosphatase